MAPAPRGHDHGHGRKPGRSPVCFVSWGAVSGRSAEIARATGGQARCYFPPGVAPRPPVLIRYLLSAFGTCAYLLRERPRAVIVTNPSIAAALVGWGCGKALRATTIIDSHPGAFGAQGDRHSARFQGMHRWLVRHADACLVASPKWADIVEGWGGHALVVHEAPGITEMAPPAPRERLRIACVGRLAPDEPTGVVLEAAAMLPDCDFSVTGDTANFPAEARQHAPGNVQFVGYLGPETYEELIRAADVVVTLTTEPGSVMRAGYEAVYAGRPLIVSDWEVGRDTFPYAAHVTNDADDLARGIRLVRDEFERFARAVQPARELQHARWASQLAALRLVLDRDRR
jgi:glycosyltransferase involved in cell wall biosynthesis